MATRGFFATIAAGLRGMVDDLRTNDGERGDAPSRRPNKPPRDPVKRFTSAHWGVEPNHVFEDPDFEGTLVEMGKLRELHCAWVDDDGEEQTEIFEFPKVKAGQRPPIVCFTTDNAERLYLSQPPDVKERNKRYIQPDLEWVKLDDAARECGGRQARWGYPNVEVQILGDCTDVVYASNKKGDGPSEWIHAFAEEGTPQSVHPYLCIGRDGRFWLAGGSYTVPDDGITD